MHLNWCRTPFIRARGESDSSLYLQDILACAICFGVNVSRRTGRNMTKLIRLCQSGFLFFLHSSLNLHADNQSGGQLLWSLRSLHQLKSLLFAPIVHWVSPTSTTRFRAQTMLSGRSSFSWVAQSMSGCSCICINRSNQVSTLTSTDTVRQAMPVLGIFKLTRYLSLSLHKQHQAWWSLANNTISQAPQHCRQISSKIAANTSEELRVAQYSNCM